MERMTRADAAERHGSMLVFQDADGLRHAVRASAILAASDADEARDATVIQLPGGRFVIVRSGLDDILPWLSGQLAAPAPTQLSGDKVRGGGS